MEQGEKERNSYVDGFDLLDVKALSPALQDPGLRFRPKAGAAIVWWSRRPDGQIDPASQHTGCPLRAGKKWAVVNWMHFQTAAGRTLHCGPPGAPVFDQGIARECQMVDYHACTDLDWHNNQTCTVFTDPRGGHFVPPKKPTPKRR